MTKRKPHLSVQTDLSDLFTEVANDHVKRGYPIQKALTTIVKQMKASGLRPRTINDYELHVNHFAEVTKVTYIEEVHADHIYEWLSSMNVNNQTKLTRLKCLKAFLNRCIDNGWITSNFWKSIKVKVDNPVKEGATDKEINILLTMLDLTRFTELRDAAAVLLMYQTGVRVGTLTELKNKHVNLDEKILRIDGGLIKNHQPIYLPFDNVLERLLDALIQQNEVIRSKYRQANSYLFVTKTGTKIASDYNNHNNIMKRINKHARDYGLKNINPHALRRGFAKNLLRKGANIALISKALGHSDIGVTTRYLHLDKEEVAESLRNFL
ncbi:tyrosine-type recombinase/integrase [Gracilibacillus thailandensis]|uniref:Tyrosine-type recombinase/integrase n=1 Tax=Gracilibacillus thailandensis TaxID=563735 RepID=A0A6N7QT91_9BACI|nr:site-specific integrase [Gracilibacillus thailandensis]MRI65337.1 tyrosine-type recombinase/integrase [Gracilibacillus thailandensis]